MAHKNNPTISLGNLCGGTPFFRFGMERPEILIHLLCFSRSQSLIKGSRSDIAFHTQ